MMMMKFARLDPEKRAVVKAIAQGSNAYDDLASALRAAPAGTALLIAARGS